MVEAKKGTSCPICVGTLLILVWLYDHVLRKAIGKFRTLIRLVSLTTVLILMLLDDAVSTQKHRTKERTSEGKKE